MPLFHLNQAKCLGSLVTRNLIDLGLFKQVSTYQCPVVDDIVIPHICLYEFPSMANMLYARILDEGVVNLESEDHSISQCSKDQVSIQLLRDVSGCISLRGNKKWIRLQIMDSEFYSLRAEIHW